jgi:rRNA-processing protein FCF1
MNATLEKPEARSVSPHRPGAAADTNLIATLIGGEVDQPSPLETVNMTLLVVHDCVHDGLLESAERAAESLVHQVRLLRLKKMADEAGIIPQG